MKKQRDSIFLGKAKLLRKDDFLFSGSRLEFWRKKIKAALSYCNYFFFTEKAFKIRKFRGEIIFKIGWCYDLRMYAVRSVRGR